MGAKINKFLCKKLGHNWDYGEDGSKSRVCERCGRTEKAIIFSKDGVMDVKWIISK